MDGISPIPKDETEMLFVIDALRDNLAGYTAVEKRMESGIYIKTKGITKITTHRTRFSPFSGRGPCG